MAYKTLYEALPFLNHIDKTRKEQFLEYFKTAPLWVMNSFHIEELDKNVIFIRENDRVDNVYFIARGTIRAIDYRVYGTTFEFIRFNNVYALGGMEYIMDLDRYQTTLQTATKCTVVRMKISDFERWMRSDIYALKQESKRIGEYLLEQGRKARAFLFLQGSNRLAFLFTEKYEQYAKNGLLNIKGNQQDLSNETGLCLKTINRAVKKFSENGLITKEGTRISINASQYEQLKEIILEIMEVQ